MQLPRAYRFLPLLLVFTALALPGPASAQGSHTVYLPLALREAVAGQEPASATPSEQLIEEAEQAGTITHEQALVYRVFALFGDSRLPSRFSSRTVAEDSQVMAHVRAEWASLSPPAQADLAPFLLPPTEPGSWHELPTIGVQAGLSSQAVEWRTVSAPATGVKVWYQTRHAGDDAKAAGLAAEIDAHIAAKLNEVMARLWMPDGGLPKNGGDDRLDIYLVRSVNYRGLATPYSGCESTPAWINVNSDRILGDATHAGIIQTAAHEMLHAVQYAYPLHEACTKYDWLAEASAKWFEHYAYPQAQSEQPYADEFLRTAHWPLENTAGNREYGAYLYPFLVTQERGNPRAVRRMWEYSGTMASLKAVNEAASFDTFWDDFARYNWNRGPATQYQTWDALMTGVTPHGAEIAITADPDVVAFSLPITLAHLSAQYFHIRFTDPNVRSVMFQNGATFSLTERADGIYTDDRILRGEMLPEEQREGITVQALYKIEGEADWHAEDWTYDRSVGFCRDAKAQRLEELVLIFANAQFDESKPSYSFTPPGDGPQLLYSDVGCWQWEGAITATNSDPYYDQPKVINVTNVVLERSDSSLSENVLYGIKSGGGTISYSWRDDDIQQWGYTAGPQSFSLTPGNTSGSWLVTHNLGWGAGKRSYHLDGNLSTAAEYPYHWFYDDDPDGSGPYDHPGTEAVGLLLSLPWYADPDLRHFDGDGGVIQGSYTEGDVRYDYTLRAKREP